MKFSPWLVAAALAGTVAGCAQPYYGYRSDYGPNYAYAPGYTYYPSRYSYSYPPPGGYTSKWDYYRHYSGSLHPGPERNP